MVPLYARCAKVVALTPACFAWIHQHPSVWLAHFQTPSCVKVEATRSAVCSAEWSKIPTGALSLLPLSLFFNVFFSFSWDIGFLPPPHWHEQQSFPTLANFFASLLAEQTTMQCSWMHKYPVSHLFFFTSSPYRPIPSPPVPRHLTCTPRTSQCPSHLLSLTLSLLILFFFPFIRWSPSHPPPPPRLLSLAHLSPLHWFADSWKTEHKSVLFITRHCTLRNPNRLFPLTLCKGPRTRTRTRIHKKNRLGLAQKNCRTHALNKHVNNPLPGNSVWILNSFSSCGSVQHCTYLFMSLFLYDMKTNWMLTRAKKQVKCLRKENKKNPNIKSGRAEETAVVMLPSNRCFSLFPLQSEKRLMLTEGWTSLGKSWITWPLSHLCAALSPGTCFPGFGALL